MSKRKVFEIVCENPEFMAKYIATAVLSVLQTIPGFGTEIKFDILQYSQLVYDQLQEEIEQKSILEFP